MLHDRPFTTLLHPDQALTVEQAAAWVRNLISSYSQSISALYHDTLPEEAFSGYNETLRSLLECAGALEQHLCGMAFFLPDDLSRTIVAIIVAVYYQSALLDTFIVDPFEANAYVVVDEATLESMSLYLGCAAARIDSIYDWLISERYAMLQGVAKQAVSEMRSRIASASAPGTPGRHDTPSPSSVAPENRSTRAKSKAVEAPFERLDSFLRRLSPDHFSNGHPSSSISNTVKLPISPLDTVANLSPRASPSSLTTETLSPFRMSLPEWELDHREVDYERRPSLTSSDTTCVDESALGSPFHLESKDLSSPEDIAGLSHFESSPDAREPPPVRPSRKRRRRTTSTCEPSSSTPSNANANSNANPESAHPRKRRRRFNMRTFGPNGGAHVGRAIPVCRAPTGGTSLAMPLPSRNPSSSPTASQTSAAMRARSLSPLVFELGLVLDGIPPPSVSAEGVPSLWLGAGEDPTTPGTHALASMLLEPDRTTDGIEVDARSEGGESDCESFATADEGLSLDVRMEDEGRSAASGEAEAHADDEDEDEDAAASGVPSGTSPLSPESALSSKAKGKRRCFAGLFRPFRDIFSRW